MSNLSKIVGKPLEGIEQFESRGSTVHTHSDGREIQRTFYLEPYRMAPAVVAAMQGSIAGEASSPGRIDWPVAHRLFPARDPVYPECYCNEVKVTAIDPRAIANSDGLALNFPIVLGRSDAEQQTADATRHRLFMFNLNRIPDTPAGGCFLTASYRPLISGWKSNDEDNLQVFESATDQRFDWINPHFVPSVRTVPWPDGFRIATGPATVTNPLTPVVPDEVAQPVNIPVKEFTVKRLFVDRPRYDLLDSLLNTVNASSWPDPWPDTISPGGYYLGIPQFAPGTLRFDSYEVIEHHSPIPNRPGWYELVYHFSWINLRDKPVFNELNELSGDQGYDWVTWNHVLMRPIYTDLTQKLTLGALKPVYGDLGWYFVVKVQKAKWRTSPVFGIPMEVGPLYSRATFDNMFMLNPPVGP